MNHLIDFGVCALVGCRHYHDYIIQPTRPVLVEPRNTATKTHNYLITFKRYFKCILGVQIRSYIVRAQLLGERPKGKYSTAKQLNGPRGFEIVLQLEKCHLFR